MQLISQEAKVTKSLVKDKTTNAIAGVEEIIKQERVLDAYDILASYLTEIEQNVEILKAIDLPHPHFHPAINTILFASESVLQKELRELPTIAKDLKDKFGSTLCNLYRNKAFLNLVAQEDSAVQFEVHPVVIAAVSKIAVKPEDIFAKLQQIAAENKIRLNNWDRIAKELKVEKPTGDKTHINNSRNTGFEVTFHPIPETACTAAILETPLPSPRQIPQSVAVAPTPRVLVGNMRTSLSAENLSRWTKAHAVPSSAASASFTQPSTYGSRHQHAHKQGGQQAGSESMGDGWAPLINKQSNSDHDLDFSQKLNTVGKHLAAQKQRPQGVYVYVPA